MNIGIDELSMSFEEFKDRLAIRLLNPENTEILRKIPHRMVCDMVAICSLAVRADKAGKSFLTVTNWMCREWGVDEETLFNAATEAAAKNNPATLRHLMSVLNGMPGEEKLSEKGGEEELNQVFLATNTDGVLGAGVILYPGFLQMAAEKFGGGFYLLPSSIHEFLLLPDTGDVDVKGLAEIIKTINNDQVSLRDQLSDHPYRYDAETKTLSSEGTDRKTLYACA